MIYAIYDKATGDIVGHNETTEAPVYDDWGVLLVSTIPDPARDCVVNGVLSTRADAVSTQLAALKAAKWVEAKAYRSVRLGGGCDTPLGRVQTDDASRLSISAAAMVASANLATSPAWSIVWTMMDNKDVVHSAEQMIALAGAVTTFTAACQSASQSIRAALNAATTTDAVAAIGVTAG